MRAAANSICLGQARARLSQADRPRGQGVGEVELYLPFSIQGFRIDSLGIIPFNLTCLFSIRATVTILKNYIVKDTGQRFGMKRGTKHMCDPPGSSMAPWDATTHESLTHFLQAVRRCPGCAQMHSCRWCLGVFPS